MVVVRASLPQAGSSPVLGTKPDVRASGFFVFDDLKTASGGRCTSLPAAGRFKSRPGYKA